MSYTFTKEKIEKYYTDSFTSDLFNYFEIANGEYSQDSNKHCVVENTYFKSLHCSSVANEGEVTPICYWWLSKEKDYIFSALFAYLYVAQKSVANNAEKSVVLEFNKTFSFPEARDLCPNGYFDVVIALKEAMLAPTQKEAKSYISVLDEVIPYMNGLLSNFLSNKELGGDIKASINKHLDDFRQWVATNTDEIVSFYGILLRKEQPESLYYNKKYILLESFVDIAQKHEIYSYQTLAAKPLMSPAGLPCLTKLDGCITAHYRDIDFIIEYETSCSESEEPWYEREETPEEENRRDLFNIVNNFFWEDEKFRKDGKFGLKDCWGRVIIPAEYEDCFGGLAPASYISPDEMIIAVKQNGKWGFVKRNSFQKEVVSLKYDKIEDTLNGVYITNVGNLYGMIGKRGIEILPTTMEDIYVPTMFDGDIMYKQDGKYGFRLHNKSRSTELFDEVNFEMGEYVSVRRNDKWGFIDVNAQFTTDSDKAIKSIGFSFESMVYTPTGVELTQE